MTKIEMTNEELILKLTELLDHASKREKLLLDVSSSLLNALTQLNTTNMKVLDRLEQLPTEVQDKLEKLPNTEPESKPYALPTETLREAYYAYFNGKTYSVYIPAELDTSFSRFISAMAAEEKIKAIKEARAMCRIGLKDAKVFVEQLLEEYAAPLSVSSLKRARDAYIAEEDWESYIPEQHHATFIRFLRAVNLENRFGRLVAFETVRELCNISLEDAKTFVKELQSDMF